MTAMVGQVEERGRLPGRTKLILEGGRPNPFVILGAAKSSISSFNMIPVSVSNLEPNKKLTVLQWQKKKKLACQTCRLHTCMTLLRGHRYSIAIGCKHAQVICSCIFCGGGARVIVRSVLSPVIRNPSPDLGHICCTSRMRIHGHMPTIPVKLGLQFHAPVHIREESLQTTPRKGLRWQKTQHDSEVMPSFFSITLPILI